MPNPISKNPWRRFLFVLVLLLPLASPAVAQESEPVNLVDEGLVAFGLAINAGLVYFLVAFINWARPRIREKYPVLLPILAFAGGPLLSPIAEWATSFFGTPVDLGPLVEALAAGGAAVAVNQVGKQTKKTLKASVFLLAAALLLPAPASAQVGVDLDIAAGGGFMFAGEEEFVFDARSLYGAVHWNGIKLPGPSVSTGLGVEFHPATVSIEGSVVNFDYRVWSLNRVDCPSALYCGVDLKIGQGGDGGWVADFDQRIVVGIAIADQPGFDVNLEIYSLEEDRPVSAAVLVRWGGSNQ